MARFLEAVIGGICVFLLMSCASQKMVEKKPLPNFEGMVLATSVDESGEIGIPHGLSSQFNTDDGQVISFLTFENMSGTHQLRWEWVSPNGKTYLDTRNYPFKVAEGTYLPKVTAWHRISLTDEPAAGMPGKWLVNLFVDDDLIDSKSFQLKAVKDSLALPENLSSKPYPKDWGLIIGIENYNKLPSVDYARKDALIVRDYFIRVLGVPEKNIISLIDKDATKAQIEGYLKSYIPSNVGKDATLYVYFAGHGMPGLKKGEPYLVPYDADTSLIEQTGYKLVSFYNDLNKLNVNRTYVFLDSCFSGMASRAAEMLVKKARPAMFHVEEVEPPSNAIISFSATSTGQISNALPEKQHGLFTYYLMRGLKGEADTDDDGWNSLKEIYGYVKRNVTRESLRLQAEQTPTILPDTERWKDVALSRVLN